MPGLRYEEHLEHSELLPFTLTVGIEITSTRFSPEANWHEHAEIQYCTFGQGIVSLDGQLFPVTAGDFVAVNTNVIHHITSPDKVRYTCLILDPVFCKEAGIDTTSLQFETIFRSPRLELLFEQLESVYRDKSDICRTARLKVLILQILIELRQSHTAQKAASGTVKPEVFERVKLTIKYIREHYQNKLSLDEIAGNVYADKYVLSREFKKTTGQTIVQYINSYRCKKARDHITSGVTVANAARMCGFENMSFFTRTFYKYMGELPSKYK